MNSRRALLAVLLAGGQALPASAAGCLDWLFCKSPYPAPYAAGYAPQATVTPLGPPTPVGPPVTTAVGAYSAYPQTSPYQAAMNPAWAANYGYNNPSVLTGAPVNPNAPIVAGYRGQMPAAVNPAVNPWGGYMPQTSYNAAAAYQAPASGLVPVPPATTGLSHPMQTTPLPPTTGTGGFMGTVLGTAYQTNYNNVPTTVYRPVQQVDPRTGQTVIVQQPCATTTQQVQRMPYGQFQQAPVVPTAPYGEATCGTEGFSNMAPAAGTALPPTAAYPQYPPQAYSQPTTAGGYAAPTNSSGVAQTSAMTAPGTYGAAPIPSTIPLPAPPSGMAAPSAPTGSYGAPPATSGSATTGSATTGGYGNTVSPPSGYGSGSSSTYGSGTNGSGTTGNGSGDASKVEQPRLPASSSSSTPSSSGTPGASSSYGGTGSYGSGSYGSGTSTNSGASSSSGTSATESSWSKSKAPLTGASSRYSDLPPIPASDAYQPPAWNQGNGQEASAPNGQYPGNPYPNGQNPGAQSPRISPPSWNDRTAMRIGEPGASDAIGHAATPTGWQRPATPPKLPPPTRPNAATTAAGFRSIRTAVKGPIAPRFNQNSGD